MKKFFLALLIFGTFKAGAQDINTLSVSEVTITDTAFNQHPASVLIRFENFNSTYDSVYAYYEITMKPKPSDGILIYQECFVRGRMLLSFNQYKAAFKGDVINYSYADVILQRLKLKSVH